MSAAEFALWRAANAALLEPDRAERPCKDCLLAFRLEALRAGLCNRARTRPRDDPRLGKPW